MTDDERVCSSGRSISSAALGVVRAEAAKLPELKAAVLSSDDPEAIHSLRVCIRRIRSAIRGFGSYLPAAVCELDIPLHDVFVVLGAVRDFDIAIAKWLETNIPVLVGVEVLERLTAAQATSKLRAAVFLAKNNALDDLARAIAQKSAPSTVAKLPCAVVAPTLVSQVFRAAERSVNALNPKSVPEDVHRLRRRIKRLRYMVEFFSGDYGKPAQKFIDAQKELQDLLGEHQDGLLVVRILGEVPDLSDDAHSGVEQSNREMESRTRGLRRKIRRATSGFGGETWRRLCERMQFEQRRPDSEM